MVRATKCARCQNYMLLDYKCQPQDTLCPWCGNPLRYRLIGSSICEVDLMTSAFDEGELCDGTGL